MKHFTLRARTSALLTTLTFAFVSTLSFAQGNCANAVSNVVFYNQTATTVDIAFTDPKDTVVTIEWGPTCFIMGTGWMYYATNDTITLTGVDSGQCYDFYFSNAPAYNFTCNPAIQYCTPCPYRGDSANNAIMATLDSIGPGLNFYEFSKNGIDNCYTNAHSFTADVDVVWEYVPSPGATEVSISTCSSLDTTRLFVLDSNQQLLSTTNTTCGVGPPSPWNTIHKSEKIDRLQVNPNMRYYIVVEVEQNDSCGSGIYFNIEEKVSFTPPVCSTPYNLDSTVAGCDAIALTWMDSANGASYMVEYGVSGFTQGNGTMVTVTDTFHLLTNLSASATYDVYVSTLCSFDTSAAAGPLTVSTSKSSGQSAVASYSSSFLGIVNGKARYQFDGTGSTADSLIWNFGDGSAWEVGWTPTHSYSVAGVYNATMVAIFGCSVDTVLFTVNVVPWSVDEQLASSVMMYPNPARTSCRIEWSSDLKVTEVVILDRSGRQLQSNVVDASTVELDLTNLANGVYFLQLKYGDGTVQKRLIVQ
ncbi:T9SS type A sorting domain-containing protein [Phaeocystidibacter luteus]|nr:T9SS type A sorting domain-containing protein [Phaeocystidibacter luteus]